MTYAVVFSGQGAQKPGMGKSLYDASPAARDIFERAGSEVRDRCFYGSAEELARTDATQPCLYTVSCAAWEALKAEAGGALAPAAAAGFSLGEYAALYAAEVYTFEEGLRLVTKRGEWMAADARGGMAAVLGDGRALRETLAGVKDEEPEGFALAVNFNCPGQTVVAGDGPAFEHFKRRAAKDGLKVLPLAVSGAFHSPLMADAAEKLAAEVSGMALRAPRFPVYSNVTGLPAMTEDIPALMARQVQSPVLWESAVRHMRGEGIDTFFELGAGRTLSGLIKKTDRDAAAFPCEDWDGVAAAARMIRGGE